MIDMPGRAVERASVTDAQVQAAFECVRRQPLARSITKDRRIAQRLRAAACAFRASF